MHFTSASVIKCAILCNRAMVTPRPQALFLLWCITACKLFDINDKKQLKKQQQIIKKLGVSSYAIPFSLKAGFGWLEVIESQ